VLFFDWLNSLFRTRPDAPAPEAEPDPDPAAQPGYTPDPAFRAHRAAHDPHFPEKRERAIDAIELALGEVAASFGFTAKPRSWVKISELGQVSLYLQRSRYGFEACVYLCFHPANLPAKGIWAEEEDLPLAWFYPEAEADAARALIYLDVLEQPQMLERAIQILSEQALPWLSLHLTEDDPAGF
jgi:hypothetical protein